ncbi:MAG: tetratricopeptide repeat protein [Alphaproteobacteria bacterium]|nr:tetratricopeptide repeat protein [Alphaproteobacteria bacterium]
MDYEARLRAAFQARDADGALAIFAEAEAAEPSNPRWPYERGCLLGELRDDEAAIAAFRKVIGLEPGHLEAWVNLGRHLDDTGAFDEALRAYDHALTLPGGGEDGILLSNRANTLLALERFEDALEAYERALRVEPDSVALRGRQTALGYLGRAEACNAARVPDSPHDRGPFYQHTRDLPDGRRLVVRFWSARHTRPDMLDDVARDMVEWIASRASHPPGLADGVKIGFGWSMLTVRERAGDVVICEPDFAFDPWARIVWDVGFTLQTAVMQGTMSEFTETAPEPCSMTDTVAVAPEVFREPVAILHRVSGRDEGFSGWLIGTEAQFAGPGLPAPEHFRPMRTGDLVLYRHPLIKVLQLPPGFRVRFEGHAVTSVVDPDGNERFA